MNLPILEVLDGKTDDHAAWDVLADWLEEHHDPRAELCQLTRPTEFPNPAFSFIRELNLDGFEKVEVPLARSNRRLKTCGLCGSEDNAQIFDGVSKFRDERGKSYLFREEIFCRTCGVFTSFELHTGD